MDQFIQKHGENVTGTLSGWDRVVFRGYLRMLCFADGMMGYLSRVGVLLKDFGEHAQAMTGRLIEASTAAAEEAGRPVKYLQSPKIRKDEIGSTLDSASCRPEFRPGFRFPFRSASTAASGFRDAWTKSACHMSATRTAFLGLTISPRPNGSWTGCTRSTGPKCSTPWQEDRPEGVRVKHQAFGNSVKVYDKGGSLLRIETTVTNPGAFTSYRSSESDPGGPKSWRPMRKGVADMHRRAEVSQQSNNRYAEALASLDTSTPIIQLAAKVCRPARKNGMRYRALRPWSEQDRSLLETISDGTFAVEGFRNGDLATRLYGPKSADPTERGRIASKVSYRLRILRAHGLIRKSPKRRRYHMTTKGRQIATALLQAQHATLQQLNTLAA